MVIAFLMMNPFHHKYRPMNNKDNGGEYNGYVAFDAELPPSWQNSTAFDDDYVLNNMVSVHGGITFDMHMSDIEDCPLIPLTSIPNPEILRTFRCIGFDTLHCDDTRENWPIEKVKEETLRLMEQIETLISTQNPKEESI